MTHFLASSIESKSNEAALQSSKKLLAEQRAVLPNDQFYISEIVFSSDEDVKLEQFDNVWVKFSSASNRWVSSLLLRMDENNNTFLVQYIGRQPEWVNSSQIKIFLSEEEYGNSVLVNKSTDRWDWENNRMRKAAHYNSSKSEKELVYNNPNSNEQQKKINSLIDFSARHLSNDKIDWIKIGFDVRKRYESFAQAAPLNELPRWSQIFLAGIRNKFSIFLQSDGSGRQQKNMDFFGSLQI